MYCVWQVVKTSTIILNNPVIASHCVQLWIFLSFLAEWLTYQPVTQHFFSPSLSQSTACVVMEHYSCKQHTSQWFQSQTNILASDSTLLLLRPLDVLLQSATSQSKHAARFLRLAMASIMDILKIKPFVEVTVEQLLWGYEDPLLKLAKDVVPKEQKLPYEEFGLMYGVRI